MANRGFERVVFFVVECILESQLDSDLCVAQSRRFCSGFERIECSEGGWLAFFKNMSNNENSHFDKTSNDLRCRLSIRFGFFRLGLLRRILRPIPCGTRGFIGYDIKTKSILKNSTLNKERSDLLLVR